MNPLRVLKKSGNRFQGKFSRLTNSIMHDEENSVLKFFLAVMRKQVSWQKADFRAERAFSGDLQCKLHRVCLKLK